MMRGLDFRGAGIQPSNTLRWQTSRRTLKIKVETKTGGVALVTLQTDHLDANNSKQFGAELEPVLEETQLVVLDVESLDFVDSSGLGALLSALKQAATGGGDIRLCRVKPSVQALFDVVRLDQVLDIYPSRREAVESFDATQM
jgi:anti-sigma B factor antagonist